LGQTLVPLVNKLQDIFASAGIPTGDLELPQVAVVGCQSSGKSSVLEALVGRDFLPRGTDICTRRPLVLQLVYTPATPGRPLEWGEFLHRPGEVFTDFEAIRSEIQAETDRETGFNKGISEKQIRLKICSPYVLTMTLVDLPGIARVPVGDQPQDIETRIGDMILSYIRRESCLILAVTPGNSDLAASDAIKLARQVDPEGRRTIGVITKLDIMDRGTNAVPYIRGDVIPLQLGYIGVVNRCQEDINQRRSIRDALASEAAFFQSHPEYAAVASRCSTSALSHTVSSILSAHIQALLPGLAEAIGSKRNIAATELAALGDGHPETPSAQGALILTMLHKYSASVSSSLKGNAEDMSTSELIGGSRIHFILRDIFVKGLQSLDPTASLTDDDIRTAIQNSAGARSILLIPEEPFELLAKQSISKLLEPCKRCASLVHEELMRLVRRCMSAELRRYPTLSRALEEEARNFLDAGAAPAEHMIVSLVQCQLSYINTSDPSFVGGTAAIALAQEEIRRSRGMVANAKEQLAAVAEESADGDRQPLGARSANASKGEGKGRGKKSGAGLTGMGPAGMGGLVKAGQLPDSFSLDESGLQLHDPPSVLRATEPETDEEVLQVKVTRILLRSYFSIVRASLIDTVPKAVMHFLVNAAQVGLQQHLIRTLYRDDIFGDLLKEAPELATHRKHLRERLGALNEAVMALNEVPEELRRTTPYAA